MQRDGGLQWNVPARRGWSSSGKSSQHEGMVWPGRQCLVRLGADRHNVAPTCVAGWARQCMVRNFWAASGAGKARQGSAPRRNAGEAGRVQVGQRGEVKGGFRNGRRGMAVRGMSALGKEGPAGLVGRVGEKSGEPRTGTTRQACRGESRRGTERLSEAGQARRFRERLGSTRYSQVAVRQAWGGVSMRSRDMTGEAGTGKVAYGRRG